MQAPKEFLDWFRAEIEQRGWSLRETAKHADLLPSTLSDLLTIGEQPSLETCKGLATAFDVSAIFVLELAGQLPRGDKPIEFDEWMGLLEGVPPEEVRRMIEVARTMRAQALARRTEFIPGISIDRRDPTRTDPSIGRRATDKRNGND